MFSFPIRVAMTITFVGTIMLMRWGYFRNAGWGLLAALRARDRRIRLTAVIAFGGAAVSCGLGMVIQLAQKAYGPLTGRFGCVAAPAMWTPSLVFTILLVALCAARLVYVIPRFAQAAWAMFTLTVGFWLTTLGASPSAVVWLPAALGLLPIVLGVCEDAQQLDEEADH